MGTKEIIHKVIDGVDYIIELIHHGGKYNDEDWNIWRYKEKLLYLGGVDADYALIVYGDKSTEDEVDYVLDLLIEK